MADKKDPQEDSPGPTLPRKPDALIAAISKTDETIYRLNKLLSTKPGLDMTLSTLNYSSHALHYLLASAPFYRLRLSIRLWLLRRLGRGIPVVPASPALLSSSSSSSGPLLALAGLISKTRFTLRLLGLLPLWTWGSTTLKSPPKDPVLRVLTYMDIVSLVIYQALENLTFLAENNVLNKKIFERFGGIGKCVLWSTRAWFSYVLLQFVRLAREAQLSSRQEKERKKRHAQEGPLIDESSIAFRQAEDAEVEAARQAEIRRWRKSLVNNAAWAPLCAHWSFENGIGIPNSLIGFIGLTAGAWGTYDAWKATAS